MNKKILLIEDNKEMRENTAEILELANYEVSTARNGKEGVESAQRDLPDLIICDIMMPVLDGYGVLFLLAKDDQTARIPFIFLSAKAERSDLRKGMDMGADDYLTKPFNDIELLSAIESRLKKTEMLRKDFNRSAEGLNDFMNELKGLDSLHKLSEDRELRPCRKKESIYHEGNYPKGVYFVAKGKVKTYKTNEQGKEFITGLYKAGDFFGYLALFEESKYTDSAMALEDSQLCMIQKSDFNELIHKSPEVSRKFIRMLSDNLHEKEEQLIRLAYNSVRKRVAEALVTLYNRYNRKEDAVFSMVISREDLANLAGTAAETTIRTLSDFKEEGLVEIRGGTITVLDVKKLSAMKN